MLLLFSWRENRKLRSRISFSETKIRKVMRRDDDAGSAAFSCRCRVCEQRGWALAATYCPFWCLVARKGHNRGFCDRRIATQQVGAGSCHNATKGRPLVSHRQRPAFSICSSVNLPPPAGYWDLFCWTWSSLADYIFFFFFVSNIAVSLSLRSVTLFGDGPSPVAHLPLPLPPSCPAVDGRGGLSETVSPPAESLVGRKKNACDCFQTGTVHLRLQPLGE